MKVFSTLLRRSRYKPGKEVGVQEEKSFRPRGTGDEAGEKKRTRQSPRGKPEHAYEDSLNESKIGKVGVWGNGKHGTADTEVNAPRCRKRKEGGGRQPL